MARAIAGFFPSRSEGQAALDALLSAGFARDQVNFIAGDSRDHETPSIGPQKGLGGESVAASNAFIGGLVGLAAGAIGVVLPGIGHLIAMGPIAGAIGGLSLGAAAGGIIGLFRDHGMSEKEAEFYADGVARGGSLITVSGVDRKEAARAREILDSYGAIHTEQAQK